jgi:hypothetical protein
MDNIPRWYLSLTRAMWLIGLAVRYPLWFWKVKPWK